VGINASAGDVSRLALSAQSSLFDHEGGDHRLKINKAQEADTSSIVFQDDFSGRAEIGLAGDDDFSFKISANGSQWTEPRRLSRQTGAASFPSGLEVSGVPALPVALVTNSVTISVPGDFATIQTAIDSLSSYFFQVLPSVLSRSTTDLYADRSLAVCTSAAGANRGAGQECPGAAGRRRLHRG
jgi:hypothetical protein